MSYDIILNHMTHIGTGEPVTGNNISLAPPPAPQGVLQWRYGVSGELVVEIEAEMVGVALVTGESSDSCESGGEGGGGGGGGGREREEAGYSTARAR